MLHNIDTVADYSATQSFLVVPAGGLGRADPLPVGGPPTKRQGSLSDAADEMAGWHPPKTYKTRQRLSFLFPIKEEAKRKQSKEEK